MQITYLGHAGFCVETEKSMVIMDPWLSKEGAFDAAWFQYPKNHHLAELVQQKLSKSSKDNYLFISHEHQDHFDIKFLTALKSRNFKLLLPRHTYPFVQNALEKIDYVCEGKVILEDDEPLMLQDGEVRLFLIDTELNCDAAIWVRSEGQSFLNLNDCKIHDRLANLVQRLGPIDVLTGQFSGASWYPTCYQMSTDDYHRLCDKKVNQKFRVIAQSIEKTKPKLFLPAAGPPCFLDPLLLPIQFEAKHTYPRARALLDFLDEHCQQKSTSWQEIMPGDVLSVDSMTFTHQEPLLEDKDFVASVQAYAKEVQEMFQHREAQQRQVSPEDVFRRLKKNLEHKLSQLDFIHQHVNTLLYWRLSEMPDKMYCVSLADKTITTVNSLQDAEKYYRITTPAWQVDKVLRGSITWPDFALTLRMTIERVPNRYDTLVHGFLILDAEKLNSFCEKIAKRRQERVVVEHQGKKYSILRYCPHQGADLTQGTFQHGRLVCPRHQWLFDLDNQGKCLHNDMKIDAIILHEDERIL